jgi:hypothetical protein
MKSYQNNTRIFVFLMCMLSSQPFLKATDFETMLISGKISCHTIGNENSVHYANPLIIQFKNNTSERLNFSIPCGFVFRADDSIYQNILVTETLLASLDPGISNEFNIRGMCMESSDIAPKEDSKYQPKGMGEPKLVELARFIEKNRFFSPAGQNAVWTYLNDLPLYSVASVDTSQAFILQQFLSELTGKAIIPIPEEETYLYNYHQSPTRFIVEGEINFRMNYKIHVEWGLYNENGILLRELYNGSIGPGDETITFSYDASAYSDPVYYLKLVTDGELLYNRKLSLSD